MFHCGPRLSYNLSLTAYVYPRISHNMRLHWQATGPLVIWTFWFAGAYCYVSRIAQKDATFNTELSFFRSVPQRFSSRLLALFNKPIDRPALGVDDDLVSVLHECNRPAKPCLGYNMPNDEPSGSTTKTSVGYKRCRATQPGSSDGSRWP